ncbi:TIGR01244 family sulfur transferase, partial [Burkholderia oklahomensis]
MKINKLAAGLSVSPQIVAADLPAIRDAGFRTIVCNQADGESADQPTFAEIAAAAARVGIAVHYLPVEAGNVDDERGAEFRALVATLDAPVLAYCRTGIRSATLWALSQAGARPLRDIVAAGEAAGYDLSGVARRIAQRGRSAADTAVASHDVVIVGAGAAGLAVASSLLARDPTLDVAVIDPADAHYYQPGWTMVGAGVFQPQATARRMAAVLPRGVHWIKAGVAAFEPLNNTVLLEACRVVRYRQLVVCP